MATTLRDFVWGARMKSRFPAQLGGAGDGIRTRDTLLGRSDWNPGPFLPLFDPESPEKPP